MGRKAKPRIRKNNDNKTIEWIEQLYPYFQINGLKGITMDEIATQLGRSKTTLYDYFQTKDELLSDLVDYKLLKIRRFQRILEDDSKDFVARYNQSLEFLSHEIADVSNLFLTDLRDSFPELWERVQLFLDENALITQTFYIKGIEEDAFNPIHPAILVMTDQLFFRALANPDFLNRAQLTIQEAYQQYMQLRFFGILKSKQ
jgi:AcrR family transcriptional regulator